MCGRFVSASPPDEIAKYFAVDQVAEAVLEPSYNVAPTNDVYVVHETGDVRRLDAFHWGLVPIWAKDLKVGNRMINARAETLADKSAYRHALRKRRCLIPVDGFYEWKALPGQRRKQPYYVSRPDGEPLALAGLWEEWRGPDRDGSSVVRSCTIITTTPNDLMATIHDRMPAILPPGAWDQWLDPAPVEDLAPLSGLLVPAPSGLLTLRPVSTDVSNVRNQGEHLIDEVPVEARPEDGR